MSKHWTPPRQTAKFKPSRIRRDPVPVQVRADRKVERDSREQELWGGILGVLLFAVAIAILTVAASVALGYWKTDDPAAARAGQFGHCYNDSGPNCVLDGDTIYAGGEKLQIAGMEAPEIQGAACPDEGSRGIEAAVELRDLLNSGRVTVSRTFRDEYGRDVRTVQVNGRDVGRAMISAGVARRYNGKPKSWCGTGS